MSKIQKIAAVAVGLSMVLGATASVVNVAGAQSAMGTTYTRSLTVGSTGADVTALQTMLAAGGFLKVAPTGYFGSLTKAALAAWQASVGISPAAGYFGPITMAWVNSHATGGSSTPGCTMPGQMFSSTTGAPCTSGGTLPAGCTSTAGFSPTTGQSCSGGTTSTGGTWSADGTDGSITVSYVSYAPTSQTLKKGDMNKPIISVKLQAVNGKVAVTRFDVHFSERPWLDFGSLTLTDASGKVLATKTLTSSADATEVTVGSDYLVRFDVANPIVVAPGTDMIVAVAANVLAASDKITGQTVYVGVGSGSIRTINGKGYTDSLGLSSGVGSGVTASTGNSVVLTSTGSTASIYSRIDPSANATDKTVITSATQTTPDVVLGVFGLKAQNQSATVNTLSFNINNSTGVATTTLYSNLRVKVGGQTWGSNNPVAGNSTFTNLSISLPSDQWVSVTLLGDVNTNQTGISASSTLVASAIGGVDANYNSLTVSTASNQTSTNNVYTTSGINVTPGSVVVSTCTGGNTTYQNNTCGLTMAFTVNNVSNSTVFLSKTPGIALSTTTLVNGAASAVSSSTLNTINITAGPGDTTASYAVPANSSRAFSFTGAISKPAAGGTETFKITAVKFGTVSTDGAADATLNAQTTTASSNTASLVNFGLESLAGTVVFSTLP